MSNPFEKRATEYLRDDAAFLSVVTPEPFYTFLEKRANDGSLFDRLSVVIGTPGSGKTTIATLLQFRTVDFLLSNPNHSEYTSLVAALAKCKIIDRLNPQLLGCRIPMESEYRDFWELPYNETVKVGLLRSFLQARAVISWLDALNKSRRYVFEDTRIIYRGSAGVAKETIGGETAADVLQKAVLVEREIYSVNAALVPPTEDALSSAALAPYHPFDTIERIVTRETSSGQEMFLVPLVMLDDVHSLHPSQLSSIRDWLARREMQIARWMLMRIDAQTPEAVLSEGMRADPGVESDSTIKKSREITFIWLQSHGNDRSSSRKQFRKMAKGMANKYLRLVPTLNRQGLVRFQDLLNTQPAELSDSNLTKLKKKVRETEKKGHIQKEVRKGFEDEIERYFQGSSNTDAGQDLKLAMLSILLNRYLKRVPQVSLFDEDPLDDERAPFPRKRIIPDSGIADGARVALLHEYRRPYYYGIDAVCDGSSENAEQFLQLAGRLVGAAEARSIRGQSATLPSKYQHQLLTERAEEIVREWIFPRHEQIRNICEFIAKLCIAKSLQPNAPLGGGANAVGVLDEEFARIPRKHVELSHILKYGIAYNALSIKRRHKTKNQLWTLVELSGPMLIARGLTLTRGGFVEIDVRDLVKASEGG